MAKAKYKKNRKKLLKKKRFFYNFIILFPIFILIEFFWSNFITASLKEFLLLNIINNQIDFITGINSFILMLSAFIYIYIFALIRQETKHVNFILIGIIISCLIILSQIQILFSLKLQLGTIILLALKIILNGYLAGLIFSKINK